MKRWLILGLMSHAALAAAVALTGCTPGAGPASPATSPAAPAPVPAVSSTVKSAGPQEAEWQKVLQTARKEGSVNFYATFATPDVRAFLDKALKEKYGLKIEWVVATGPANAERIRVEQRSKQYVADVWWSGASVTNIMLLRSVNGLETFRPPIIDEEPGVWRVEVNYLDKNWDVLTMFQTLGSPITINTNLVRPEDYPKSYKDLLQPKWKGKIIMQDPTISGGASWVVQLLKEQYGGWEYFEKLKLQEPVFLRDFSELARRVAMGEAPVGLGINVTFNLPFVQVGAPIKMLAPEEGATLGSSIFPAISHGPHPNATRVLLNYLLTKEAQEQLASILGQLPVRKDVSPRFHPTIEEWTKGMPRWRNADWEFMTEIDKDLQAGVARKLFGIR